MNLKYEANMSVALSPVIILYRRPIHTTKFIELVPMLLQFHQYRPITYNRL